MQDNESGSEQHGDWQPPEYVSPWAAAPDSEPRHDTISFGAGEGTEQPAPAPGYGTGDYARAAGFSAGPAGAPAPSATPDPAGAAGQGVPGHPAEDGQPGFASPGGYGGAPGGYGGAQSGYGGAQSGYGGAQSGYGDAPGNPGGGVDGTPGNSGGGYGGTPGNPGGGYGGAPGYGGAGFGGGQYGGGQYGGGQYPPGGYGGYPMGGPPPPPRGPRFGRAIVYAAVAVLAAGAGAGAAVALGHNSANNSPGIPSQSIPNPQNAGPKTNNGGNGGNSAGLDQQAIARKVDPGVVDITSTLRLPNETAEGTGMILSANGLVLTNNHVINDASKVTATLVESGKTYRATVLGYDSTDDVALLKLDGASGLPTVSVGNSDSVKLGDQVLALGNAQGRGGLPSLAPGIINALNRSITASDQGSPVSEKLSGMLQTNAPIQEGDSGGPLVNTSGQVIGMDTAANSQQGFGSSSGTIGFAIPINRALSIARNIAEGHASSTVHLGMAGFMGVGVANVSQAAQCTSNGFGGGGGGQTAPVNSGALVCNIYPGTPAASSGLAVGDVIVSVDGHSIANENALTSVLAPDHPGQKVAVTYVDINGTHHNTTITLIPGAK